MKVNQSKCRELNNYVEYKKTYVHVNEFMISV